MTESPERALLRRLDDAWRDGGEALHSFEVLTQVLREARALLAQPAPEGEDATTRYERLAEAFYCDTGLLAPGKDVATAMWSEDYELRRQATWEEWTASHAAYRPLPRAEAEAMVEAYDHALSMWDWWDGHEYRDYYKVRVDEAEAKLKAARAALLRALTGGEG